MRRAVVLFLVSQSLRPVEVSRCGCRLEGTCSFLHGLQCGEHSGISGVEAFELGLKCREGRRHLVQYLCPEGLEG